MKPRVAIVAALERELRPLVKTWKRESRNDGVTLFFSSQAIAVCAGIGSVRARLAAQAVLAYGSVYGSIDQFISAGWAGGLHAGVSAGAVHFVKTVIDATTGERLEATADTSGVGAEQNKLKMVLVTSDHVVSTPEKGILRQSYNADLVDMEAATVARVASENGIPFFAVKAVSDSHDFDLPSMEAFTTPDGQVREGAFASYIVLRPALWKPVITLARHSATASNNLASTLQQYLARREMQSADQERTI